MTNDVNSVDSSESPPPNMAPSDSVKHHETAHGHDDHGQSPHLGGASKGMVGTYAWTLIQNGLRFLDVCAVLIGAFLTHWLRFNVLWPRGVEMFFVYFSVCAVLISLQLA